MMSIGDVMRYVPGIVGAPGREQPRSDHHPRQQLVGRLLRQRRARRRAVLPRSLQPESRRGAQGTERDDVRPRRRRRRGQPRQQGGAVPAAVRSVRCRAGCTATSGSRPTSISRSASKAAFRVNGMYEDSDSFRDDVGLKRYGITPTLTFAPSSRTKIVASYEYLHDTRVADRGITSFQGRPVDGRSVDLLRQSRGQPRRRQRQPGIRHHRASGRAR